MPRGVIEESSCSSMSSDVMTPIVVDKDIVRNVPQGTATVSVDLAYFEHTLKLFIIFLSPGTYLNGFGARF